jgi:transcriptional regulator with XRE-family HTH domain
MVLIFSLKVERLERGLSQDKIADQAKVNQSTWSRAERGLAISPGEARKIARFLDKKLTDVWDFDDEKAAAA